MLLQNILKSIYKNTFEESEGTHRGTAEVLYNDDVIGLVDYCVTMECTSKAVTGNWNEAPERGEYRLTLDSAFVTELLNENGKELENLKNYINVLLEKIEGKELEE